ncbi:MAG: T9SS type A sorting domain-containing protein [Bacteroidales bacterium]|nr:T9SS type A sorting domain-containing protein [Bacteroidales bacterium]
MKRAFFIVATLFFVCSAFCQKSVVATGGSATGMSGDRISYSVGQISIGTAQATNFKVFEGVQQPIQISEMSIDEALRLNIELKLYPNPTNDAVCIYRSDENESRLTYTIFSTEGAEIMNGVLEDVSTTVSLQNLPAAVYLLRVTDGKQQRAYRIIKK